MFVRRGRKYRTEFRENFEMLVNAQIATEDQLKRTDEQLESFATKTEQAFDRLTASQVRTEETLDRFLKGLSKGRNGDVSD